MSLCFLLQTALLLGAFVVGVASTVGVIIVAVVVIVCLLILIKYKHRNDSLGEVLLLLHALYSQLLFSVAPIDRVYWKLPITENRFVLSQST